MQDTVYDAHFIGGEQFTKFESPKRNGMKAMYFYIAFCFTADLLFVWEGQHPPYYMRKWAPQASYDYTNKASSPTTFLLKLKAEKPLTPKEQSELGLHKMNKFEYDYFYW